MLTNTDLSNLELGLTCMLGSFFITVTILLTILIFIHYQKSFQDRPKISKDKMKRLSTRASMLSGVKPVFHFKDNVHLLGDNEESLVSLTFMFRTFTEKLALKIKRMKIGGKTLSTKPFILDVKEMFFRIHLNNNVTNSMVVSEVYNFALNVSIDESFLFSLQESQLGSTVITIELFGILIDNNCDLLFGWLDIHLPGTIKSYPIQKSLVLKEVFRPLDLYVRQIGYLCVGLQSICDKIKLLIFASTNSVQMFDSNMNIADVALYFNIDVRSATDLRCVHTCRTAEKPAMSTIVWNEIFLIDVEGMQKKELIVNIESWQTNNEKSLTDIPLKLTGIVKLGLFDLCPEKSQLHWRHMCEHENEESFRWHPIRLLE